MSERKTRKVHRAAFKAKVGLEAVRGAKTINEIGQQYGVHPVLVGQWKRRFWIGPGHCSRANVAPSLPRMLTRTTSLGRLVG